MSDAARADQAPRPGDPRARRLLERYLQVYPCEAVPVPVQDIAEDLLGLRVRVHPRLEVSGMLLPAERLILVSGDEPPQRRRFTVAHEIGHWVVHCGERAEGPIMCRLVDADPGGDVREREANVFAADLVMPGDAVRALTARSPDRDALARMFGVSVEAMGWRLYNLGMASRPGPGG